MIKRPVDISAPDQVITDKRVDYPVTSVTGGRRLIRMS